MARMVQARSQSTQEKVLEAAEKLVVEHGHEAMALKDLVKLSGVSNGSIFHHFGSKDGVLDALFTRERRAYLGYIGQQIIAYEGDPCDALGEGAKAALDFQARDPNRHFRVYVQFTHSEWMASRDNQWNELAQEIEMPVMQWAVPHLAAGRLPALAPVAIQSFMLGSAELLSHQWRAGRVPGPLEAQGPLVAKFVASGLKAMRDETTEPNPQ